MADNADLQYIAAIDTSAYDSALDGMVSSATQASSQIESESAKINELLTNVPEVNIDFLHVITDAEEMREGIGQAFAQIAGVIRENEKAIGELAQMYNKTTAEANKFANVPSMKGHYKELKQQQSAIKEVIAARKEAIKVAKETEAQLEKEKKSLLETAKKTTEKDNAAKSLKQTIKELEAEAAMLVKTAQDEGIELDQTKGRYREIIEELGRLKDIRGDIQAAGSVFANDENQIAGVIQGLSGLSGAFTAAQGVMGLFGSENEKLQQIMLKVQSVMAITMGLQQVQQVLNKDSTFSLVTLNAVKRLFTKHTEEATDALSDENKEIAENIEQTQEEIVQKEASEVAKVADNAATVENTTATNANSTAQTQNATAEAGATVSTEAHTGAMTGATLATRTLTAATKLLKVALISTGIGALVVLVGELVSMVTSLFEAEDEATKHAKELGEVNKEANETYIKQKVAIEDDINACKNFTGTKEQERKKVEELNNKYGDALGYYDSLEQWEKVLIQKGPAYCTLLQKKAQAQALLNKYVDAYVEAKKRAYDADRGVFDRGWYNPARWFGESNEERRDRIKKEADEEVQFWEQQMKDAKADVEKFAKENGLDEIHIDPKSKKIKGGGSGKSGKSGKSGSSSGSSGSTFDPKKAAADQKKALEEYQKAVQEYVKKTNAAISQSMVDAMTEGYFKEMTAMRKQMDDRKKAWQQDLMTLAEAYRDTSKAYYLAQKGATEEGWNNSEKGKRTLTQWAEELLKDEKIKANYEQGLTDIDEALQQGLDKIQKKYFNQLVNDFGTYSQKFDQLSLEWQERLGEISTAFPEFLPEALKQMEREFAELKAEDFQKTINWDVVFGNLEDQSLQALQFTLGKVKSYFAKEGENMTVEQIKIFQEAIDKMETEIASRNPFTAMHKSYKDIKVSTSELKDAIIELTNAQDELTAANNEYKEAFREENELRDKVNSAKRTNDTDKLMEAQRGLQKAEADYAEALRYRNEIQQKINDGELAADCEELSFAENEVTKALEQRNSAMEYRDAWVNYISDEELAKQCLQLVDAQDKLKDTETKLANATEKNNKAEQRTLTARNNVTKAYKTFATNLNNAGKATTDVGKKASDLARVFAGDIADGMDKALDCIDEVLDATTDIISSIGDLGKKVTESVGDVVDGVAEGTKTTAAAAATSISTVEKASIILTVISAALQVATAIASLFNDDDKKQEEIERLQQRIDQLQWELDNQDVMRLISRQGDALQKLTEIYNDAKKAVLEDNGINAQSSWWNAFYVSVVKQNEIYAKSVEKLADYWGSVAYTADKALGVERYSSSRKQLENMAEQQLLLQKQMNEEASKKDSDDGKIQDYKNKIAELAEEMATLINEMLEDIIGGTAEDIAKTLGDAFFEAVKSGEDAMEQWHNKVKDIIADIMQRMLIQEFLETRIGKVFDKYRSRWFGDDGSFAGMDVVKGSMQEFASDLNTIGEEFQAFMDELPDEIKDYFTGDSDREASQRGIATASQDSVDENNARLTVIQTHTYTLVQLMTELNGTSSLILQHVVNIDDNTKETAETLVEVQKDMKRVKDAVENITTQGIKLK